MTAPSAQTAVALLVDCDEDTRRMYAEFLQLHAWQVEEAADGREALAKALAVVPSLVVTETRLSGISGLELCTLLRRDDATRRIPIVIVTADAFKDDLRKARATGADSVLVKPCLPERLLAEMKRVLALSSQRGVGARTRRGTQLDQLPPSLTALTRSQEPSRHSVLERAHVLAEAVPGTSPPLPLVCPQCDRPLTFDRSHVGGVGPRRIEQWDYFTCPGGCGMFQYRVRTRKLRKVS